MNKRPYAVFDIDGTLIRWQLYHAVADVLAKQKIIDRTKYQSVLLARANWKTRQTNNSFENYEKSLIKLFDETIPGMSVRVFNNVCDEVITQYRDQVYTYTRDLITKLKQKDYFLLAISASPEELVKHIAAYYKFDDFKASHYETKDGKLTGHKAILYGNAKTQQLTKLIKKHNLETKGSIAIGDTLGDLNMLSLADKAIAFNPASDLLKKAKSNRWEIVIERKNVVYRLEYRDGKYLLA